MSKNYLLRQTPQFEEDFKKALWHIAVSLKNPMAADALTDEFERVSELVRAFPLSVQPYPTKADRPEVYRAVGVKRYLAFYVVLDGVVEFRRFLYAGTDIPSRL